MRLAAIGLLSGLPHIGFLDERLCLHREVFEINLLYRASGKAAAGMTARVRGERWKVIVAIRARVNSTVGRGVARSTRIANHQCGAAKHHLGQFGAGGIHVAMNRQVLVEEALRTVPEAALGLDDFVAQGSEEFGHLLFSHFFCLLVYSRRRSLLGL